MPREALHWYVAQQSQLLLGQALSWIDANAYLLGAMAPDAGYFFLAGKSDNAYPEKFHGKDGQDTWEPIRQALHRATTVTHKSFILGCISHILTDAVFHPAVYFLTGNYYDQDPSKRHRAVTHHRLLETRLDSWIRKKIAPHHLPYYLKELWRSQQELRSLCLLIEDADFSADNIVAAFNDFGEAQHKFLSSSVGAVVRVASCFSSHLKELDGLFSFARWGSLEVFESTFSYRHPVTGDRYDGVSWRLLLEQAVSRHQEVFAVAIKSMMEGKPFYENTPGPSLNFGLPSCSVTQARYFLSDVAS